jgi:hypothetical protein
MEFLARNCLTAPCELEHCHGVESNRWAKIQAFFYTQLHITASVFPHNKLVLNVWPCGMNSKWTVPLISKVVISIFFVCDFDMRSFLGRFYHSETLDFFYSFSTISLGQHCASVTCILS